MAAGFVVLWMGLLSGYDIRCRRLPDWLTLPAAVLVPLVAVYAGRGAGALAGAAALSTVYLVVHLIAPGGLGGGDVKLAVSLGALTGAFGAPVWSLAAVAAPLLTAGLGLLVLLCRGGRTVPHGPSMCAASAAAVALGAF
ncbi:prepilin peptidase [Mycobacterium sp. M1]|uniref:Prepilin peptidase n=1 Tax=Mycolicibacter acidiphilus TaxID=2835306 RepID=A0ABS5RCZ8_9MYCO|nr:A24 family peptidase [Mycolicibacter acidiphilus]MBS9532157.1 prepilin peptidase [Mycolicibacter acidiphilus]